jgi:hypothetical protein
MPYTNQTDGEAYDSDQVYPQTKTPRKGNAIMLTYRTLLEILQDMPASMLDTTVTVHLSESDELFGVGTIRFTDETEDRLDPLHPVLTVQE